MKLKELEIGSKIIFGRYSQNELRTPMELVWTKVTEDGKLVLRPGQLNFQFDAHEGPGANRDRRAHGYNYYPLSNVFQFINSPNTAWYGAMNDHDRVTQAFADRWGFLSHFTGKEIDLLMAQDIEVGVPEGSRKQYGTKNRLKCLVTLPSASQVGIHVEDYLQCEGEEIPLLKNEEFFRGFTRSGAPGVNKVYVKKYGYMDIGYCDGNRECCPMISVSPETDIVLNPEVNVYVIDPNFVDMGEIMTDDFLTMVFQ